MTPAALNRSDAMKAMRDQLGPLQELRRRFSTGRPANVEHTPISAVSAACAAADAIGNEIKKQKIQARFEVGVVAVSVESKPPARMFAIPQAAQGIGAVIDALYALPHPQMVGLIFAVVDSKGGFEMWHKAFKPGREYQKVLDLAVADQVNRLRSGGSN